MFAKTRFSTRYFLPILDLSILSIAAAVGFRIARDKRAKQERADPLIECYCAVIRWTCEVRNLRERGSYRAAAEGCNLLRINRRDEHRVAALYEWG
jgi:hypothetical protein